jgi:hypothetical protein
VAEYYLLGESIECSSAAVVTRKSNLSSIIDHPVLGRLTKYKCERNSSAEILKELNPKKFVYCEGSRLDTGDLIKSEAILVLVSRMLAFSKAANVSATHSAQKCSTSCFTFAEITKPFAHIEAAIRKRLEEEKRKLKS